MSTVMHQAIITTNADTTVYCEFDAKDQIIGTF